MRRGWQGGGVDNKEVFGDNEASALRRRRRQGGFGEEGSAMRRRSRQGVVGNKEALERRHRRGGVGKEWLARKGQG